MALNQDLLAHRKNNSSKRITTARWLIFCKMIKILQASIQLTPESQFQIERKWWLQLKTLRVLISDLINMPQLLMIQFKSNKQPLLHLRMTGHHQNYYTQQNRKDKLNLGLNYLKIIKVKLSLSWKKSLKMRLKKKLKCSLNKSTKNNYRS